MQTQAIPLRSARRRAQRQLGALLAALALLALPAHARDAEQRVERVVDGDTLVLEGGERVRLLGVDTPETVHPNKPVEHFGKEASAFTRRVAEGQRVRLQGDAIASSHDRYRRRLAYVYLPDGKLLNLEIIRQGYGFAYTRFPFARLEQFRAAEREAREQRRGLWAEPTAARAPPGDAVPRDVPAAATPRNLPQSMAPCIPAEQCCKICSSGQACGASCISRAKSCRKGRGCACNAAEICR
jgi:endonuclease YncB( thermonuclease family)